MIKEENPIVNHWLEERSLLFAKYAKSKPKVYDKINVKFGNCEFGFIDLHFQVNGIEKGFIELSDVYEPFSDIKLWLENIVINEKNYTHGVSMVEINCERYGVAIYYEPMLFIGDTMNGMEPWACKSTGLFYVYDGLEKRIIADAYCDTRTLINDFYIAIVDYAKDMQSDDNFIENWVCSAYNNEIDIDTENLNGFFLNKVKSDIVEDYIENGVEPQYVRIE